MFQERIDAALAVIAQHNQEIENPVDKVDGITFVINLKRMGGTSEERLASFSHEDILDCFTMEIRPRILAKTIAKIFRGKEEEKPTSVSAKKADKMTLPELVASFDPEDFTNPVGKRLGEISKGQPFIHYSTGRIVSPDVTLKMLTEIKQGYSGREDITLNGETFKLYRLGELPDNYVAENPLYPGRPLRPDGTCDQTGRSWEGVPLEVRQFIRVAMGTKELVVDLEKAHNILDIVVGGTNPLAILAARYRKSDVVFRASLKTDNLPKLLIKLGNGDGFPKGQKVMWVRDQHNNYRTI